MIICLSGQGNADVISIKRVPKVLRRGYVSTRKNESHSPFWQGTFLTAHRAEKTTCICRLDTVLLSLNTTLGPAYYEHFDA